MQATKHILFVDDEESFLSLIKPLAEKWSKGDWEVFVVNNAGKALSLLQETAMDIVVIDIQMPVMDGVQFLGLLHLKYPSLHKVVLTGLATINIELPV